jgi:hypothetical protein
MAPNRRGNYPGRPQATYRATWSAAGGGVGRSASLGRYVLGMQIPSAETREPWQTQSSTQI